MMRSLLAGLALLASATALAAPRVAVVQSDDLRPYQAPVPAFLEALDEPALVMNLHGRRSDAQKITEKLRRETPNVVVCLGAKAAYAVREALPHMPIVYISILEPHRYGIGGTQTTGVLMTVAPEIYLSQLVGFFPEVKTIGVLRGPSITDERVTELTEAARAVGVELVVQRVDSPRSVRQTFGELAEQVDALWLQPDREVLTRDSYRTLTEEARRRQMPLLVETDNMVRAGGLFAVVPDYEALGTQAAELAKRIADGAAPAIMPVERPEVYHVALNLGTVRSSNIAFEELLLDFVDIVVE